MIHTPGDLMVWALSASVTFVILGLGLAPATFFIRAAMTASRTQPMPKVRVTVIAGAGDAPEDVAARVGASMNWKDE